MTGLEKTRDCIAAKLNSEARRLDEIAARIRGTSANSDNIFWEGVADGTRHLPVVVDLLSDLHEEIAAQANKLKGVNFIESGDH